MAAPSVCTDTSEAVELFEAQGLFLKPIAKLNVCVQLPQLKTPGKTISNWEVMEKIKYMIKPYQFITLKIVKSTLEFLRFEGEMENQKNIRTLIQRLDGKTIKLSGFTDSLKVRAAEAKLNFPSRHDWDAYFRDAKHMNEMKPGERPDTIHIRDAPCRWFAHKKDKDRDRPSEYLFRKVLEQFGEVRCTDIPMLDPYRSQMQLAKGPGKIQTFSYGQDLTFEAFIQYQEYIGFVKAMDALRGMKLMYKSDDGKAYAANIRVDFDKSKHLSDKNIRRRRLECQRLEQIEKDMRDREQREREEEERRRDEERRRKEEEEKERERKREEKVRKREERRMEREEKRRMKKIERRRREEEKKMRFKIALEERKILIAQRKLESIRLLTELFDRVKVIKQAEELVKQEQELEEDLRRRVEEDKLLKVEAERQKLEAEMRKKAQLARQERELREKILKNLKTVEEKKQETLREELRKKLSGKVRLKSAVIMNK